MIELNKHEDAEKYINIAINEHGLNSELNFYRINLIFKVRFKKVVNGLNFKKSLFAIQML